MPKFQVTVAYPVMWRTTYEIEALDGEEARRLALLMATNGEGEFNCDEDLMNKPQYEIDDIQGGA